MSLLDRVSRASTLADRVAAAGGVEEEAPVNRELTLKDFLAAPTFDQKASNAAQSLSDAIINLPRGFTNPEVQRAGGRIAGGIVGGAVGGVTAGPLGVAGGTVLGSAAGGQAVASVQDFFDTLELPAGGLFKEQTQEVMMDLGVTGVGTLLKNDLVKRGAVKMLGIATDHAKKMAAFSKQTGVPVGIADVSSSSLIRDL